MLDRKEILQKLTGRLKWLLLGVAAGIVVGSIGSIFSHAIGICTAFRREHGLILLLLPAAGLLIAFLYSLAGDKGTGGTNRVIRTALGTDELSFAMAPLIFISTTLTHLFGGSAGREGAALQLGGALGFSASRLLRLNAGEKRILTMCGMSAAFSALFGTPMAASFFALELGNVGAMPYAALLPCVAASLSASVVAKAFGVSPDRFAAYIPGELAMESTFHALVLSLLCAILSIAFCLVMHKASSLYGKYLPNPYLRILAGGAAVVLLTLLVGSQTYNGAGLDVIERALKGETPLEAFLLKLLFTALTLGAGFHGGEIVPALCVGATFGSAYAQLFAGAPGVTPASCAAVGMCSLFCGVTNCPVSSLLLSFELFGYRGMPYYLLAVTISFAFSGYFSLYGAQDFYSKKYSID